MTWLTEFEGIEIAGFAHTGRQALESVVRLKPDAVILDLGMLYGPGMEILAEMKRVSPAPLLIVLSNSQLSPDRYRERCLASGADFFLDKSTDFHRIVELLEGSNRERFKQTEHLKQRT